MSESATDWLEFFNSHAPRYMENPFTRATAEEVDFIIDHLKLHPGNSIVDIGCGTGRHCVEFAKRGYAMTGVDFSSGMLEQAREAAADARVQVEWIMADVTTFRSNRTFDAAICLCEGGFGLAGGQVDPVTHDLSILKRIFDLLRPGGKFILTALNGYSIIRRMTDRDVAKGSFDPATMIANYWDEWDLPEGKRSFPIRERLLIPPEVVAMMRHVGFVVDHVWGGTAGDWGERPVKLDEVEAMYIAKKPL